MRVESAATPGPRAEVVPGVPQRLPDGALVAFVFGPGRSAGGDPRILRTGLSTIERIAATEVWRGPGLATTAVEGPVRYSANPEFLFGFLDLDEGEFKGVAEAAETAYRSIRKFQDNNLSGTCSVFGTSWIRSMKVTAMTSDNGSSASGVPGDSAISRWNRCQPRPLWDGRSARDACRCAGWRDGFLADQSRIRVSCAHTATRARRLDSGELIGSGTSSIVGHESRHDDDLAAQVDETLSNLRELHRAGGDTGKAAGVKVYLRERAGANDVDRRVRAILSGQEPPLLIQADICRKKLLVEIECLWI